MRVKVSWWWSYRKQKKIPARKKLCFFVYKPYSSAMSKLHRCITNFFWKLEGRFRSLLFFLFVLSLYFLILYKWQNPGMTPLMSLRLIDQIVDGRKIVIKHSRMPIENISNNMIYGVIAGEDQRFLDHRGVDFQALWVALEKNIKNKSLSIWGSTITQQTAKNVFLWPDRSLFRKIVELYFSMMIELIWNKERIMEVYLNIIEFWDGIYWVEQAARYYFNISAVDLTQSQSSFLVAIMPNPRYYQTHQNSYKIYSRKSIISRSISSMKRNKEIKAFVEAMKE